MTIRNLPEIKSVKLPDAFAFEADAEALDRWTSGLRAAQAPENTISILEVIGEDMWTGGGITGKRVAAALRQIGPQDVFVDINSPGGDFFEGVAIYNMLRAHKHKVTVRVLGLAASAASLIAMAGDQVEIGKTGFLMIHNAWVVALGNRHDMLAAAETLAPFDDAMASVYSDRSGADKKVVARWMDDETWFNGEKAVSAGLADSLLAADFATETTGAVAYSGQMKATMRIDAMMARSGISRSERRSLLGELKGGMSSAAPNDGGTSSAAPSATHNAGAFAAAVRQFIDTIKT